MSGSIVSGPAGTTRDMIAEGCRLGDLKCRLADTAGMRRTQDPIELQGITIAKREAEAAQVVFVVLMDHRKCKKRIMTWRRPMAAHTIWL